MAKKYSWTSRLERKNRDVYKSFGGMSIMWFRIKRPTFTWRNERLDWAIANMYDSQAKNKETGSTIEGWREMIFKISYDRVGHAQSRRRSTNLTK